MSQKRNNISSLQFLLSKDSGPLYQQLYQQIVTHIQQGRLMAEDRLPGSRVLSDTLGVSRSTVVNTYDKLIAEGVLISRSKRGIYVSDDACLLLEQHKADQEHAEPIHVQETTPLISFNSGIDADAFPQQAWLKSMRASWRTPDPMVLGDNCPTGLPALKRAVADYLYQLRGLSCSPEQILITAGSRDALTLIRHALEKAESGVFWQCENPTYPPIRELVRSWRQPEQQQTVLSVDTEGCVTPARPEQTQMKVTQKRVAQKRATATVLTPNRQYPTGVAMSSTRRQEWMNYLLQGQGWLIEDDYDNEFHYNGKSGIPLMQVDRSGRVLFVGSFSKVLFRGLRLGFIVASRELYPLLQQSRIELGGSAALPMQPVVAEFMQNGEFARHINRMRRHYRQKRDYLLNLCEKNLSQWFDWQQPQGGMHLLIFLKPCLVVPPEIGDQPLEQVVSETMLRHRIRMQPLSGHYYHDFRPGLTGEHEADGREIPQGFVLGFTGPDEQTLTHMIESLARTLSEVLQPDAPS